MRTQVIDNLKPIPDTERRYGVMEMHLFDENAREEQALCGRDTTGTERRDLKGYLEDRLHSHWVGTVCQDCKVLSMPLAKTIIKDKAQGAEDEGRWGKAEDWRRLAEILLKETGQDRSGR